MRVLLIDNQTSFAGKAQRALLHCGFAVDLVPTLDDAAAALPCATYHILIIELLLPDGNSLNWIRHLRSASLSMPIIATSTVGDIGKRIETLNAGADDFLSKPFSTDELIARMRAILRRSTQIADPVLSYGNLRFDPIARQVSVGGRCLRMARREVCILEHLLQRAGRTVPRSALEDSIYAFDDEVSTNALEVGIYRLRAHLTHARATLRIRTVRGIGYTLELYDAASAS
ncbi:Transcriptional regulatory protein (TtsI) [Bradyrhizobium sp. ORS 285]|uniref:winged helix-turn-helix domain-containing protein n=1 Tax=Bradyrhizobium sp. ORS 285 TaxID=115808 RepID=UPI000240B175|nr:response regulator transcription factor [Bradyrhizobium sp. ORS 285]CCD85335.1 putative transcriptional regulatory protein (y4xI-like) [Bradyrhizobium sp. ORS 285]SMX56548.1 Transcriptional regulatory protein (TtsI) [Bradyrhizobium sp. ORS 285]